MKRAKRQGKSKNDPVAAGYRRFDFCALQFAFGRGFTMVEVVVMMTIMVTISGMVLVSFTGLHEGSALSRAVRELALAIRKVQNTSLAVTQVNTNAGPKIPSAVGLRLTQGASVYVLFADLTRDNKYDTSVILDDPDARIGDDQIFERGVKVKSLTYTDALNNPATVAVAHIIFAAPEAAVFIGDQDGNTLGDILKIELTAASGNVTKTVTVRTSGQVSIR
ncbi:MAG: hypothetical protein WAP52_02780 [Candidatus Sungiibacteriota bacterium]